jgi:tetratricopeptide (TPR) repeat protein
MENYLNLIRACFVLAAATLTGCGLPWATAHASDEVQFASVKNPCTERETWEFGRSIPPAWQARFSMDPPTAHQTSHQSEFIVFSSADALKRATKNVSYHALGDYQQARAMFRMGLLHLAQHKFNDLFSVKSPDANGLKIAALGCLAVIHERSPSLVLLPESIRALSSSPVVFSSDADRKLFFGLLTSFSERQIAGSAAPDLTDAMALLKGSGPYLSYVLALQNAKLGNTAEALKNGEAFLGFFKDGEVPEDLKTRADATRVLMGEMYYENAKYDDAGRLFRGVSSDSNYLGQALTNLAWSHLLVGHYDESMSAARNLLLGLLKRTFSPESNLISAIAFLETCHYTEALQAVKMFQKNYWPSYNWLYSWHKGLPAPKPLYPMLATYMKKQVKIPERIASEWMRSPIFIRAQEDLNLNYDERDSLKTLLPELGKFRKNHRGLAQSLVLLSALLEDDQIRNRKRESDLVATINTDLAWRSESMLHDVADAWGNSQLLVVETYNRVGDKMVADNFSAKDREIAKNRKNKKNDAPVWDWGRAPAVDDDSAEIWDDEVGFLQMDLTDQCQKPRN